MRMAPEFRIAVKRAPLQTGHLLKARTPLSRQRKSASMAKSENGEVRRWTSAFSGMTRAFTELPRPSKMIFASDEAVEHPNLLRAFDRD